MMNQHFDQGMCNVKRPMFNKGRGGNRMISEFNFAHPETTCFELTETELELVVDLFWAIFIIQVDT